MSNIIRIKRRLNDGVALSGAPASLHNAEMAFNEVDNTLYYGRGDNGSGMATEVIEIGGKGYIETLVSSTSSTIMHTISDNLSTVLGTDIESLAANLNSIQELAQSLSGDADFAVTVNNRLNSLQQNLSSSSGNLGNRVTTLEEDYATLTGASQVTVLGTIASQDSNNVTITDGTISVSTLTVTGNSSVAGLSASGALDVAGKASLKGAVDITGAVDMASTLDVTGAAALKGGVTVTGAASVSDTLSVTGAATLNGGATIVGAASVSDTLSVTGAATLNGGVTVVGSTTLGAATLDSLHVLGAADIDSTLNVDAKATLESLEVTNAADFKSDVSIAGNFEVGTGSATLYVSGQSVGINTETPSEALDVAGNIKASGSITAGNGLTITSGALAVTAGNISVAAGYNIEGGAGSLLSGFIMDGGLF